MSNHKKPESLAELAEYTTLHGVRFLATKNVLRRIFWAVCVLGAAGLCAWQLTKSVEYFRLRPFSTVLTIKKEAKANFPDVTICNLNSIHTRKFTKQAKTSSPNITDEEIEQNISELSKSLRALFDPAVEKIRNFTHSDSIDSIIKNLNSTDIFQDIDDILLPRELLSCTWAGKTCGKENFKPIKVTKYTQCFTFKPQEAELNNHYGYIFGLRLRMNVGAEWYLPNSFEPFVGQKVFVHPSGEYPHVEQNGFFIEPGVHTSCVVRRKQIVNLGKPYQTNCGEEELKFVKTGSYSYSRRVCIQDCYHQMLAARCHCKTPEMAGELPLCIDDEGINCVLELNKIETKVDSYYIKCMTSCRESCKYNLYNTKLSTAKLNARSMAKDFDDFCKMKNQHLGLCQEIRNKSHVENIQYVRDNVVSLDVYLEDDYYEEVAQKPAFEWFELMSDIGGNLGLFLGVSILTLVEYVEYVIRILWYKLRTTVKSKTVEVKSCDSNMS